MLSSRAASAVRASAVTAQAFVAARQALLAARQALLAAEPGRGIAPARAPSQSFPRAGTGPWDTVWLPGHRRRDTGDRASECRSDCIRGTSSEPDIGNLDVGASDTKVRPRTDEKSDQHLA
jgi:hypothetical protein